MISTTINDYKTTYVVNESKVKVNTLSNNSWLNKFKAKFSINVDRILSNGMTDITIAFEDWLFDERNKYNLGLPEIVLDTILTPVIGKLIRTKLKSQILPIKAYVFVNSQEVVTFESNLKYRKHIKRIPFTTLKLPFEKLSDIVIKFATNVPGQGEVLLKEYQLIFSKAEKEKLKLSPLSNNLHIKTPFSYNFNFETDKSYWKELYYNNIFFTLNNLTNRKSYTDLISAYEYNDVKRTRFRDEISFNGYIPVKFEHVLLDAFLQDKIELITYNDESNNLLIDKTDYESSGVKFYGKVAEFLYTDENQNKIQKTTSPYSAQAIKIPYKFNDKFTASYHITSHYFDLDIIRHYETKGTNAYENVYNKKLKIKEIKVNNNHNYKFVINLNTDINAVFSDGFNLEKYFILEEDEKKSKFMN
ncbi:MHO_1580 family protein [Mycoplasma seminis]|uniref:DUF1410 domain-containing protein n=1 Tax=Mycoplasma seminis TaxID=512749 RepID=A0ABY9HA16_9MOLU|nr:hypothetical protein [Mycoplasma seminis]WLP85434.1 hypothetical protein Q8852_03880 [Mycoplasma seminis]